MSCSDREAKSVSRPLFSDPSVLIAQVVSAETELSELATTRTTLIRLTSANESAIPTDGTLDNTVYQQILAAFTTSDSPAMRAREVCHTIGLGTEHKDTEGVRAKLKRLVKRGILTETGAGQFVLTAPAGLGEQPATSGSNSNSNLKRP
jgi:hypothetical protein